MLIYIKDLEAVMFFPSQQVYLQCEGPDSYLVLGMVSRSCPIADWSLLVELVGVLLQNLIFRLGTSAWKC